MRILHVLTYVGPGNPFGGPTRVAMNQAEELRRRGHEVDIVAAQPKLSKRGNWGATGVQAFDSSQVLPGAGFSGIASFGLYRHLWKHVRDYDVVHIHLARDLITMPATLIAQLRGVRYVVQTHGMIDPSNRRSAKVLDVLATRRALRRAARVFVLTEREMTDVRAVAQTNDIRSEILPNGIKVDPGPISEPPDGVPEALFCSRLQPRKRPSAFVNAAIDLLDQGVAARFTLMGPDEGELASLEQMIEQAGSPPALSIEPPVEPTEVASRLAQASVVVLPSVDEPFPMVVLESLAVARPVIVTESCGLADFVREHSCGVVVAPDDHNQLTSAMQSMLVQQPETQEMGRRGREAVTYHLGIERTVDQVEAAYEMAR